MANEIRVPFHAGYSDLWAMIMFDDSGTWKVRDVVAGAWDVYANADLDDYDIGLTEGPLGIYLGNAPSLSGWADGDYAVVAYQGSKADGTETAVVINIGVLSVRGETVYDVVGVGALIDYRLDHMVAVADSDDVVNDSIIAKLVSKDATADWSDYDNTTESLEALKDGALTDIEADTNELQTDDIPGVLATAQADLNTITGTGGVLIGTDAMDRSGTLDVNTKTITANAITATAINADAITEAKIADSAIAAEHIADAAIDNATFAADVGSTAYATNIIALAVRKVLDELNLDHLLKVSTGVNADADLSNHVVDKTVMSHIMTVAADTSTYKASEDSLEAADASLAAIETDTQALQDVLEEPSLNTTVGATVTSTTVFNLTAGVANDDAYIDATICVMDNSNSSLAEWRTIVDYTGATKTVTLDRALSFTPQASTDEVIIKGKTRNNAVAGGTATVYTVTDDGTSGGNAVPDVHVWVTIDSAGNTIVASGDTDSNGEATFYLDSGETYYFWKHKAGYTFESQPESATAS